MTPAACQGPAAGNEGSGGIVVDGFNATRCFDLSIGDPANLEQAIAAGSVHPTPPLRYGTSYHSSRGLSADGRLKPDVVGPGERILSCRSSSDPKRSPERDKGKSFEDLYIALSGSSMAAPHISGLLAAFLSVRTEFIGYPGRVKRILLEHCTDLKRDPQHQGAGLTSNRLAQRYPCNRRAFRSAGPARSSVFYPQSDEHSSGTPCSG